MVRRNMVWPLNLVRFPNNSIKKRGHKLCETERYYRQCTEMPIFYFFLNRREGRAPKISLGKKKEHLHFLQSRVLQPTAIYILKCQFKLILNCLGFREHAVMEKIKEAHRRVMVANHPDSGGSNYLASKVNEAKDVLMGRTKSASSAF